MVLSNNSGQFAGVFKILGRIKEIDNRIDELSGAKKDDLETIGAEEPTASFASVLGTVRQSLGPRANKWVVEDAVQKASEATGLDIDLIKAVMQQESGGNSNAVSSAGAKGLMQMIDSTAASMGVTDPFDPHQNALGGAKYLKQQLQRFGGNLALALAAYNAGPEAVSRYKGIPPYAETTNYVRSVSAIYQKLKNKGVA